MTISKKQYQVRRTSTRAIHNPKIDTHGPFVPQYSSVETLHSGRGIDLGEEYTRGLPRQQCLDRFENAKHLAEVSLYVNYFLTILFIYIIISLKSQPKLIEIAAPTIPTAIPSPEPIITVEEEATTNHASSQSNSVPQADASRKRVLRQRIQKIKPVKRRRLVHTPSSDSSSDSQIQQLPTKSFLPIPSRHQENVGHISKIEIGGYIIDVWYLAPYPEEYSKLDVLYVCEYCLKYIKSSYIAKRHKVKKKKKKRRAREREDLQKKIK